MFKALKKFRITVSNRHNISFKEQGEGGVREVLCTQQNNGVVTRFTSKYKNFKSETYMDEILSQIKELFMINVFSQAKIKISRIKSCEVGKIFSDFFNSWHDFSLKLYPQIEYFPE